MRVNSSKGILLSVVFASIIVGMFFVLSLHTPSHQTDGPIFEPANSSTSTAIAALIDFLGPAGAQRYLFEKYRDVEFAVSHPIEHAFGRALFERYGLSGISYCGVSGSEWRDGGCYHELLGVAIGEHGADVVGKLEPLCESLTHKERGYCFHAIGHGLINYFGYDDVAVKQSLEICEGAASHGIDCAHGAFMEYHLGLLRHGQSIADDVRSINGLPYAPCTELGGEFRHQCFAALPNWWRRVVEDRAYMGNMCGQVVGRKDRELCYFGIGRVASWMGGTRHVDSIVKLCDSLPNEGKVWCFIGAAVYTYRDYADVSLAKKLCGSPNPDTPLCTGLVENEIRQDRGK